jgi:glycerophosphoryl diester phosphodiesterase
MSRPRILGHRGARAHAPMNTMPAFRLALEQGADGLEFDVRMTRDGSLVILHDPDVDETSDGVGPIADLPFDAVRALDFGAWFGPAFAGTRIPTLDEVMAAFAHLPITLNIEIKSDEPTVRAAPHTAEAAAAAVLTRYMGAGASLIVSSFDPASLARMHAALPAVPLGYLSEPTTAAFIPDVPLAAVHPHWTSIDAAYMAWAHAHGWAVNTWTVNDEADAHRLAALGVDALITDDPARLLALFV